MGKEPMSKDTEEGGKKRRPRTGGRAARRAMVACVAILACQAMLAMPAAHASEGRGRGIERPASQFGADVPVEWARLLYDRIRFERLSPPVASRLIGYAEVALYEAVAPGMPDHRSLGGQLNGLAPLPQPDAHAKYHWPSVANSTLADTLRGHLVGASAATLDAIDALEQRFAGEFSNATPPQVLARSVAQGRSVASALLAWAAADGFAALNNCPYTPPVGDGLWVRTPPAFAPPLQPCWGGLRPFALPTADACAPPPPPSYSTDPASAFYAEGQEVYDTVKDLATEQRETALYWSDDPGRTGTPPGHSLMIAAEVIEAQGLALDTAAEAFARVGIAVADAFISCWRAKYVHNLLRPVTYSQSVLGDPAWTPILTTPPFPEYTSGHSVQSGAAAEVLTDQFGALAFTDVTEADLGFAPRSFDDFFAAAHQAAISRLYGGIHFRSAIDRGVEQGVCVGRTLLDRVHFRAQDE